MMIPHVIDVIAQKRGNRAAHLDAKNRAFFELGIAESVESVEMFEICIFF